MDRVSQAPAASSSSSPPPAAEQAAFDADEETSSGESGPSSSDAVVRSQHELIVQHLDDQARQMRLDRLRAAFDAEQAERAEYQREMNVLRDMALEQQKHDDEILKKWIALI